MQWVGGTRFPPAWLSIGGEDDDLEGFLRSLLAAWEEAKPRVGVAAAPGPLRA